MIASVIQNEWVYVGVAWGVTVVALGGYAVAVLRKGRALARQVPEDKQRWM